MKVRRKVIKQQNTKSFSYNKKFWLVGGVVLIIFMIIGLQPTLFYINTKKYDSVGDLDKGLAKVEINAKFGFINKYGREVVPLKYTWIGDFNENLAKVELLNKVGFIDRSGKEIIPLEYKHAELLKEGIIVVILGSEIGFIDKLGREITPVKYNGIKHLDGLKLF